MFEDDAFKVVEVFVVRGVEAVGSGKSHFRESAGRTGNVGSLELDNPNPTCRFCAAGA
jgi:hypothetical protein